MKKPKGSRPRLSQWIILQGGMLDGSAQIIYADENIFTSAMLNDGRVTRIDYYARTNRLDSFKEPIFVYAGSEFNLSNDKAQIQEIEALL